MAVLAAAGLCAGLLNVLVVSLLLELSPQRLLGRVMSLLLLGSTGLQPFSFLLSGYVIDAAGVTALFLAGGTVAAAAFLAAGMIGAARRVGT